MKKLLIPGIVLLLVLIGVITGLVWWNVNSAPPSSSKEIVRFVIPKGYGATQIANKLYEQKLIKSPLAFRIYVQVKGISSKIQAGEYDLSADSSLFKLIGILLKGPTSVWVTIPEGLRREEVALKFAEGLAKTNESKNAFINEFLESSKGKEGFLFPDTYLLPKDIAASKVANYQLETFNKKTTELSADIAKNKLSLNEIITLASLIEREAKGKEERPIIAGILLKRVKADWPLQVDASLQYAIANSKLKTPASPAGGQNSKPGNYWEPLTKEDIEIKSPFNTYKYTGLPPSPIANPGLLSIKAAVYPQESSYWFYLHDKEGKIHYAATIEEHNENIKIYLGKSSKE